MRVVEICTNAMAGSVGRIARELCDNYIKSGNEVLLCYGRGQTPPLKYNPYKIDSKAEVLAHAVLARLTDSDGLHSIQATKKLVKKLKDFKPDIVQIHCLHGYYINYPILFDYFKQSGVQVMWTMHDCWAFTGHCAYFTAVGCDKWRTCCHDCEQLKSYPKCIGKGNVNNNFLIKKKAFCDVKKLKIITPSEWLKDLVKESFLSEYDVEVVYNRIDGNAFKPTCSDFRIKYGLQNKYLILSVANIWDKRKGLDDLLLLSKELDEKYQLVIVGLTKAQIRKLPQNIIGITRTDSISELAGLYSSADVFINPTHEDNYPTVNLEAQACGTYVITYDTGGSKETLRKDKGIAISPDVEVLKNTIEKVTKEINKYGQDNESDAGIEARNYKK